MEDSSQVAVYSIVPTLMVGPYQLSLEVAKAYLKSLVNTGTSQGQIRNGDVPVSTYSLNGVKKELFTWKTKK